MIISSYFEPKDLVLTLQCLNSQWREKANANRLWADLEKAGHVDHEQRIKKT